MGSIRTHVRGNIVGYVALFFALSASAYAAGLAPNSVKSKHIKDGQVQGADLAENSVNSTDVADQSLFGNDLANNSVGGQQINESTLGEVPNATIAGHGGYGRQSGGPELGTACDPDDDLYFTCAEVGLTPSAQARFFVTGRFLVFPHTDFEGDGNGDAQCRLGSSSTGGIPGTSTAQIHVDSDENSEEWVTIVGITDAYQPGNYSFGLDCRELGGDVRIASARVTAVAISPF